MKIFAAILILSVAAFLESPSVSAAPGKTRTIDDIPGLPVRVLRRTLSSTIYKHILVSPVEGWIAVRGRLSGIHLFGLHVFHSELDGVYDKYALQVAGETQLAGYLSTGHINPTTSVVVNVLIYEIADGIMALSFPCLEEPGGGQKTYYGGTTLAVQEIDGKWRDLDLPLGPLGKVWVVQQHPGYVKRGFGPDGY